MEKRIANWLNKGIITPDIAEKLLNEVIIEKEYIHRRRINILIYTIAAVLLGLGVITFIAANDWILKLFMKFENLKIISVFLFTCLFLWGGYRLSYVDKKLPRLGQALIVISTLSIGATYALIGQTYNINAHNSGLFFVWFLSILPVAYLFKNYVVNIISIILLLVGIVLFYMDLSLDSGMTWTIFIPVLIGTLFYTMGNIPAILEKYNNFSFSYKVTGLTPIFVTLMILVCSVEDSYTQTSPYYIVPIIALIFINIVNYILNSKNNLLLKIETCFMIFILLSLLLILIVPEVSVLSVMIFANFAILFMIGTGYYYGYKFDNYRLIGLNNWFLIIYIMTYYCRYAWDFLDKSLFFILGGLGLLTLGIFLEKKKNEVKKGN